MGGGELSQDDIDALLSGGVDVDSEDEDVSGGLEAADLTSVLGMTDESGEVQSLEFQPFSSVASPEQKKRPIDFLFDVNLTVRIELGRCVMEVEDVLGLGDGSVVELDKLAGDPVDVLVNGRLVARGEVLVLNEQFCVRITEIISPKSRIATMTDSLDET